MKSAALILLSLPYLGLFAYGLLRTTHPYYVGDGYSKILRRRTAVARWIDGPGFIVCLIAAGLFWR